jgi:hypothetical protein
MLVQRHKITNIDFRVQTLYFTGKKYLRTIESYLPTTSYQVATEIVSIWWNSKISLLILQQAATGIY